MFFQKGFLFVTALALLPFVGQASAGPNANAVLLLDLIPDGGPGNQTDDGVTAGTVSGQDTKIAVEVFAKGVTTPLAGVIVIFDFDPAILTFDKAETSLFRFSVTEPDSTGTNFATHPPITLPESGFLARAEFTTAVDVTDKPFTLGIKMISLAQSIALIDTITTTNVISFNALTGGEFAGMQLYLDTQIETPAVQNTTRIILEQTTGDTIQFQLFAPMAAGKQTDGYEIELDLPGKTFTDYIGQISGTSFTGASLRRIPDRPGLSARLTSISTVPDNGYLGQIDLQVTKTLKAKTTLIVKAATMADRSGQQDSLDVSKAVITIAAISHPGDFDGDFDVDFSDFIAFAAVFGLSSSDANYDARMDIDNDGVINFADFLIFVGVFDTTYS